jgi:hypothetical protein
MTGTYTFKRGEPIAIDLVVDAPGTYDPATLTIVAKIKPAAGQGSPPPAATPATVTMASAFHPAATGVSAYWQLTAPGSAFATPGLYIADAEIFDGSTVLQVTDPILIKLVESVTPA